MIKSNWFRVKDPEMFLKYTERIRGVHFWDGNDRTGIYRNGWRLQSDLFSFYSDNAALSHVEGGFEYQGYHFIGAGNFEKDMPYNILSMTYLNDRDPKMGWFDGELPFDEEEFRRAGGKADVFFCLETQCFFCTYNGKLAGFDYDFVRYDNNLETGKLYIEGLQKYVADDSSITVYMADGSLCGSAAIITSNASCILDLNKTIEKETVKLMKGRKQYED